MTEAKFKNKDCDLLEISQLFGINEYALMTPSSDSKVQGSNMEALSAMQIAVQNAEISIPTFMKEDDKVIPIYQGYLAHDTANICFRTKHYDKINCSEYNLKSLMDSVGLEAEVKKAASKITYSLNKRFQPSKKLNDSYDMITGIDICSINNEYNEKSNINVKNRIQ